MMYRSMAAWINRMDSVSPTGVPKVIVPRQTGDTSNPLAPSGRCCMAFSPTPPPDRWRLGKLPFLPVVKTGGVVPGLGDKIQAGQTLPSFEESLEDRAGSSVANWLTFETGGVDESVGRCGTEDLVRLECLVAAEVRLTYRNAQLIGQLDSRSSADAQQDVARLRRQEHAVLHQEDIPARPLGEE